MISLYSVKFELNPLNLIRESLESIEIHNSDFAHLICKIIPARCPFEREVKLFKRALFYIPPLCKLNPFYEQLVGLRFKCLCYLANECGEDITAYC